MTGGRLDAAARKWVIRLPRILVLLGMVLGACALVGAWLLRGPWVVSVRPVATTAADPARLRETVEFLSVTCHPRSYRNPENLERAADFIVERLREAGDSPTLQDYKVREGTYRNVIVRRPGTDPDAGMVIIGAHYDAYMSTPGANDNASGVAALLELARTTRGLTHRRTWLLVAFSTEEPPFFGSGDMGSARLARSLAEAHERVELMVALDMVGAFSDEPGSQVYPLDGMGAIYPSRANFLAVTGDFANGHAIAMTKRGLLAADVLPVVSFRGPRSIGWVDLSDHQAFWEMGMPAALVTDTAMLRTPGYHGADDTADRLDYARMSLVVQSLEALLVTVDLQSESDGGT